MDGQRIRSGMTHEVSIDAVSEVASDLFVLRIEVP